MPCQLPHQRRGACRTAHAAAGAPPRRLGLALAVIATAQLMVVPDTTIVNNALPHIQDALRFSGSSLEWVVNGYTLAFGGLLLLGGRSGDLLGRRRIFIFGIVVFSVASLLGGLATSQAWLLSARAVQGVGAAFAAPTALSLIAVTFPEGAPRNRAMAVYASMSVAGGSVGLIASGLLVNYANWRWVLFVNVPIGVLVALLAPRVLSESERRPGNFDLPGAVTASLGLAALVYGLSSAATTSNGVSHWGDTKVIASLVAAVVLLGGLRGHRGARQPPAASRAGAAQPGPFRRLPDRAVRGHGAVRDVLLPDALPAGRLGVQRAEERGGLPADHGHGDGDVRRGVPACTAGGRAAAAHRGLRDRGGRAVLALAADRAQQLRGRDARPDDGHGRRDRADVRPDVAGRADQGRGRRRRRRVIAADTGQQVGGSIGLAVLGTVAGARSPPACAPVRRKATRSPTASPAVRRVGGDHPAHPGRRARHAPGEPR